MQFSDIREWTRRHSNQLAVVGVPLVAVIAAAGFLVQSYEGEQSEQRTIQEQLGSLARIASSPPGKLEAVRQEFDLVQEAVPSSEFDETEVFEVVLGKAESRGLTAQMSFQSGTLTKVGDTKYRVRSFTLTASGSYDAVWDLLQELDGGPEDLKTMVLNKVSLSFSGGTGRASVDFVVYTRIS